ncbi:hypothetical protein BBJ28_00006475 [Nothophytophthora sp. Chile5]|nr:hypothetical protein BBJ28_00006475 [Nothophytophthora sp. Chile5]
MATCMLFLAGYGQSRRSWSAESSLCVRALCDVTYSDDEFGSGVEDGGGPEEFEGEEAATTAPLNGDDVDVESVSVTGHAPRTGDNEDVDDTEQYAGEFDEDIDPTGGAASSLPTETAIVATAIGVLALQGDDLIEENPPPSRSLQEPAGSDSANAVVLTDTNGEAAAALYNCNVSNASGVDGSVTKRRSSVPAPSMVALMEHSPVKYHRSGSMPTVVLTGLMDKWMDTVPQDMSPERPDRSKVSVERLPVLEELQSPNAADGETDTEEADDGVSAGNSHPTLLRAEIVGQAVNESRVAVDDVPGVTSDKDCSDDVNAGANPTSATEQDEQKFDEPIPSEESDDYADDLESEASGEHDEFVVNPDGGLDKVNNSNACDFDVEEFIEDGRRETAALLKEAQSLLQIHQEQSKTSSLSVSESEENGDKAVGGAVNNPSYDDDEDFPDYNSRSPSQEELERKASNVPDGAEQYDHFDSDFDSEDHTAAEEAGEVPQSGQSDVEQVISTEEVPVNFLPKMDKTKRDWLFLNMFRHGDDMNKYEPFIAPAAFVGPPTASDAKRRPLSARQVYGGNVQAPGHEATGRKLVQQPGTGLRDRERNWVATKPHDSQIPAYDSILDKYCTTVTSPVIQRQIYQTRHTDLSPQLAFVLEKRVEKHCKQGYNDAFGGVSSSYKTDIVPLVARPLRDGGALRSPRSHASGALK